MLRKMRKSLALILFSVIALGLFLGNKQVLSGAEHNVSGWAWSETIGWISFNSTTGGGGINYGVNINTNGNFSGYAWSENIGWITFNQSELSGCPQTPCRAKFNKGTGEVSGWARALVYEGSEDGWISLRDSTYGVSVNKETGEFEGWAWGSDIIGWISFNCNNPETGDICSISDYKVQTSFRFNDPPVASMSCDISGCSGGACNGSWIAYRPTADPTPCVYKVNNDSTDDDGQEDIVKTEWYLDEVLKSSCSGICDYTLQDMSADDYVIKLYVEDSEGESDFTTHSFAMREEVRAGFMCSLDNENWESCETISVAEDEILYLKDHASLPEHSTYSEGASGFWTRIWEKGDGETFEQFGPIPGPNNLSTTLSTDRKVIRLTVADNQGRLDYQDHNLSVTLPLPEWQEVAPF